MQPAAASKTLASLTAWRVLIVDDDPHLIRLVGTLLRGFGLRTVAEAKDAPEGFAMLGKTTFDTVIVDYQMKPLDGLDFIRLVRTAKDSAAPEIPIVMLTAHADLRRVQEARDAGVNEFLRKPITATELLQKLTNIIERPRPFIRSATYIGPCRRRRSDPHYKGPERRQS